MMTGTTHIPETERDGRSARLRKFAARLFSCCKAATISEYGLIAMLLVSAAGVAHSPRLHAVKDTACEAPQATCFHEHSRAAARAAEASLPAVSRPAAQRPKTGPGHAKRAAAPLQPNS